MPPRNGEVIPASFFAGCALLCIDIQEGERGPETTGADLPPLWKKMGFTAADVNAATAFAWEVCLPNAIRVTETCRGAGMKMIFVHWGYRFEDGMDLDPEIYRTMIENHGTDYTKWSGYIGQPGSRPARCLGVRPEDYVLAKSGQDAFTSSNLGFVLRNLGVKRLVMLGGHTGACLGKTARSAKRLGFEILCVEDATSDARESTRRAHIDELGFDHVVSTDALLGALGKIGI